MSDHDEQRDPLEVLFDMLFGPVPAFAILSNEARTGPALMVLSMRQSRSRPHRVHYALVDPEARRTVHRPLKLDMN